MPTTGMRCFAASSNRRASFSPLVALVHERRTNPGQPVSAEALIAAGWPDERMAHEAGMNRLKVALATARKLGLRELLVRQDGGYLLDPGVDLTVKGTRG